MPTQESDPFEHASHNLKACYTLKETGKFNDWVVTTAFYAGMKFLQAKFFPGEYEHPRKPGEMEEFKSFSHYLRAFGGLDPGSNKHREMSKFIARHAGDVNVVNSYEDLKQACHTARYINYKVGTQRVDMANEALQTIKNFCVA